MPVLTVPFSEVDKSSIGLVGGKGANLGELSRAGLPVPDGFCLTTKAFREFLGSCESLDKVYARLEQVDVDDRPAVGNLSAEIRAELSELPIPEAVRIELLEAWRRLGADHAYAVRSSATAEDLADASFAGQHDTCLNVTGEDQLLDSVRECWLSLFTDRAISYRARNGFDHRQVELAVVVQQMVLPQASGVLFTADPVSGDRGTIVINAAHGLGEAVVSGLVNPDLYRIDRRGTLHKAISDKRVTVVPRPDGGVDQQPVPEAERKRQALPDAWIEELAATGRRIRDHYGTPQDIEWAWADGRLYILQSRPITSLYPLPDAPADGRLHVYFSLGHQQMMLDAMKPLALSVVRNYFPFGARGSDGETGVQLVAGNRLFIDYTDLMHTWIGRMLFAHPAGTMDKRMGGAFLEVAGRAEFQTNHRFELGRYLKVNRGVLQTLSRVLADLCWTDLKTTESKKRAFIEREASRTRAGLAGTAEERVVALGAAPNLASPVAFDTVRDDADPITRIQLDMRKALQVYFELTTTQFSAAVSRSLIDSLCARWLGDAGDISALDKSLPGNVTTEMSMAIGDLADLVRDRPELQAFLQSPPEPFTLSALDTLPGGVEFRQAFVAFLDRYGMRCPGELDITRPRWHEEPVQLFAGILANTRTGRAGEHRERFDTGEREAEAVATRTLERIRRTGLGRLKAAVMSRLIEVYRVSMGMREHQKFLTVQLYDSYRTVIRGQADALVEAGVLATADDVDFLTLHELKQLVTGNVPDSLEALLRARKAEYQASQALRPPRLVTSDGEIVVGLPVEHETEGVLTGVPVSAGVVEGRARIVHRPEEAELEDGDILVAPFTDPAWTPLFSAVRGMVVEIGGLMTHGAVVARELGLPAVVGVDNATQLIADGSRVRVDGSQGTVELI